jgi:hypothetical protein
MTTPAVDNSGRPAKSLPILVLVIAIVIPLLAMIPTGYGYLVQRPPEKIFMGFRYMADDHNSYATFINQSAEEGKLFMENRYTTEPQKGRFVLLYMWLVGTISRLTGLGVIGSWELARFLAGFGFMLAAWCFSGVLFDDTRKRLLAYVFVGFSGGIGWLLSLLTAPLILGTSDGYLKDTFNFQWNWSTFGSMVTPLWVAPAALLLVCAYLIGGQRQRLWQYLGVVLPPLIWFMHPYTGIAAYLTFALFPLLPLFGAMWRLERLPWESVRERLATVWPMLLSTVIVLSYIFWAKQDQVYAASSQRVFTWTPTYSIFLYPFAYGLLLPLALYGIRWSGDLPRHARDILIAWLAAATILSVNPFLAGVKFQYLVHLPLAFFAVHGLVELKSRSQFVRNALKGAGVLLIGALLFLNSALLVLKVIPTTASDRNIFLHATEMQAMAFLKQQPPGNVLSSVWAGNRIAWLSAKKVYVGHWFLTIDGDRKLSEVKAFFGPELSVEQKRSWLATREIRYVYYGGVERYAGTVDPALGLKTIYDQNGVTIYAVP